MSHSDNGNDLERSILATTEEGFNGAENVSTRQLKKQKRNLEGSFVTALKNLDSIAADSNSEDLETRTNSLHATLSTLLRMCAGKKEILTRLAAAGAEVSNEEFSMLSGQIIALTGIANTFVEEMLTVPAGDEAGIFESIIGQAKKVLGTEAPTTFSETTAAAPAVAEAEVEQPAGLVGSTLPLEPSVLTAAPAAPATPSRPLNSAQKDRRTPGIPSKAAMSASFLAPKPAETPDQTVRADAPNLNTKTPTMTAAETQAKTQPKSLPQQSGVQEAASAMPSTPEAASKKLFDKINSMGYILTRSGQSFEAEKAIGIIKDDIKYMTSDRFKTRYRSPFERVDFARAKLDDLRNATVANWLSDLYKAEGIIFNENDIPQDEKDAWEKEEQQREVNRQGAAAAKTATAPTPAPAAAAPNSPQQPPQPQSPQIPKAPQGIPQAAQSPRPPRAKNYKEAMAVDPEFRAFLDGFSDANGANPLSPQTLAERFDIYDNKERIKKEIADLASADSKETNGLKLDQESKRAIADLVEKRLTEKGGYEKLKDTLADSVKAGKLNTEHDKLILELAGKLSIKGTARKPLVASEAFELVKDKFTASKERLDAAKEKYERYAEYRDAGFAQRHLPGFVKLWQRMTGGDVAKTERIQKLKNDIRATGTITNPILIAIEEMQYPETRVGNLVQEELVKLEQEIASLDRKVTEAAPIGAKIEFIRGEFERLRGDILTNWVEAEDLAEVSKAQLDERMEELFTEGPQSLEEIQAEMKGLEYVNDPTNTDVLTTAFRDEFKFGEADALQESLEKLSKDFTANFINKQLMDKRSQYWIGNATQGLSDFVGKHKDNADLMDFMKDTLEARLRDRATDKEQRLVIRAILGELI